MNNSLRLVLPLVFLLGSFAFGAPASSPWVSVDVPEDQEAQILALLVGQAVPALGGTNAVVEISAFEGLEVRPWSTLKTYLVPQDPRWDPWLTALDSVFRPQAGVSRIWVAPEHFETAQRLTGSPQTAQPSGELAPPMVTGWMLVGFSLLYLLLRLTAEQWRLGPSFQQWRWLLAVLGTLVFGLLLMLTSVRPAAGAPARASVSWAQHRWFQEAWAYGASWDDWKPGEPWTYPTYERKDGKLTEIAVPLATPDEAWIRTTFEGLDPKHAARIFGLENP